MPHSPLLSTRSIGRLVVIAALSTSLSATAAVAFDSSFPPTITVDGKSLKKIGSGLREFLFFDIYKLAAYSQSGSCDANTIVSKDEAKYLRLDMLREIPKARMVSTLRESLEDNLPANASPELKAQVEAFLGSFKGDVPEGARVEISYVPGKGTTLKQSGHQLGGVTTGKAFADTLWRAYFGRKTCCSDLKEEVLEECRGD